MKRFFGLQLILLILVFTIVGCSKPSQKYLAGLEATNQSIIYIAKEAKTLCDKNTLSAEDCLLVKDVYEKIRLADNAVIDATKAAIIAGQDVSTDLNYIRASQELMNAVNELIQLSLNLKIIGGK